MSPIFGRGTERLSPGRLRRWRRTCRGVVVNDPPALGQPFEDECKETARRLFASHELPAAAHPSHVIADSFNLQLAKGKLSHLAPFGLVAFPIACQGWLPSLGR